MKRAIRRLATVPRWTIIPTIQSQSVAEHSFFVALYADWIATIVGYEGDRANLTRAAMLHDQPEIVTGDLPSPVNKCKEPAVSSWAADRAEDMCDYRPPEVDDDARWIIKCADLFDSCMFLVEEIELGNRQVSKILRTQEKALMEHIGTGSKELNIWLAVDVLKNRLCETELALV